MEDDRLMKQPTVDRDMPRGEYKVEDNTQTQDYGCGMRQVGERGMQREGRIIEDN